MTFKVVDIVNYLENSNLEHSYLGDMNLVIENFCSLNNMKEKSITWIKKFNNFDIHSIDQTLDLLIVTTNECLNSNIKGYNVISCDNPKEVFFSILTKFFQSAIENRIEPTSTILTNKIGKNVSIGHNCYINKDVVIGDNVVIKHNVVIDCKSTIGANTTINSGVVIGTDGFGYYKSKDIVIYNVPHFGGVIIGEGVDIGSNTCVDRGTIDDKIIGDYVKIDNLCHIAHNVQIKENSYVIASSILCESCILEKKSYITPGAVVMNQLTIGENSLVGLGAVVTKNVEPNKVVAGVPAKVIKENTKR
jgi:UDP-3-O-[3-hydroxymyristoyl] glucosamine N-acyltransferase